jgi:NodT family efflux transporter outer membrane factor (OMF) lipoprotein
MRGDSKAHRARRSGTPALAGAVSLLGVLSSVGGCAVGPSFTKPEVAVFENWRTVDDPQLATQTAVDSEWWKAFNDPALDRLVELAGQQNLPLQIAGVRIAEARAQLGVANGRQFPQVQLAVGSVTAAGLTKRLAEVAKLDRNYVGYQVGLDVAWELDAWGKYRREVEAQTASEAASVADYHATLVSLNAEVARTYVLIRTIDVLIEQARENARVQEESLKIAESRFHNGATSELDTTQAEALLQSTRASIPRLQIDLQQARNALSTLLGQPTGTVDALLAGPRAIPQAPEKLAVGVPAEMLRRRPDVHSAELQAAAQSARIGVAKSELYPRFVLLGTVGLLAASNGVTSHSLFSADSFNYSIGPEVAWSFFTYGRLENGVRVQDARLEELLVGYRQTVLKAAQEVEDALSGFVNARAAMTFERNSVKASQRSVEISLVQYREGAVDYQRVLDAQRSLLAEQNSLVEATSSVATYLVLLYKALGGGWEVREGRAVVPEKTQHEMNGRTDWGGLLSPPPPSAAATQPSARKP